MRLRIALPVAGREELRATLDKLGATIEAQDLSLAGDQVQPACVLRPHPQAGALCSPVRLSLGAVLLTAACGVQMQLTVTCLVEPGAFREIHALVQHSSEGEGWLLSSCCPLTLALPVSTGAQAKHLDGRAGQAGGRGTGRRRGGAGQARPGGRCRGRCRGRPARRDCRQGSPGQ